MAQYVYACIFKYPKPELWLSRNSGIIRGNWFTATDLIDMPPTWSTWFISRPNRSTYKMSQFQDDLIDLIIIICPISWNLTAPKVCFLFYLLFWHVSIEAAFLFALVTAFLCMSVAWTCSLCSSGMFFLDFLFLTLSFFFFLLDFFLISLPPHPFHFFCCCERNILFGSWCCLKGGKLTVIN